MAKIWQAEEGRPLGGAPVAEKTLNWCVEELGLRRVSRLGTPSETVVLGAGRRGARRYVVIGLDDNEITAHSGEGWKSGYYLVLISVDGLKKKLSAENQRDRAAH